MQPDEKMLDRTGTPDGEEARGNGAGIEGTGRPIVVGQTSIVEGTGGDLQEDMGRDPTLVDEDSGD